MMVPGIPRDGLGFRERRSSVDIGWIPFDHDLAHSVGKHAIHQPCHLEFNQDLTRNLYSDTPQCALSPRIPMTLSKQTRISLNRASPALSFLMEMLHECGSLGGPKNRLRPSLDGTCRSCSEALEAPKYIWSYHGVPFVPYRPFSAFSSTCICSAPDPICTPGMITKELETY